MQPEPQRDKRATRHAWACLLLGLVAWLGGAFAIAVLATLYFFRRAKIAFGIALASAILSLLAHACYAWVLNDTRYIRNRYVNMVAPGRWRALLQAFDWYAFTHDGRLPEASQWCDALYPTCVRNRDCFQDPMRIEDARDAQFFYIGGLMCLMGGPVMPRCTWGFNAKLSNAKLRELPPDTVLFFDARGGWNQHGCPPDLAGLHWKHSSSDPSRVVALVVFVSGHRGGGTREEIEKMRWEP
ncbi:MAG TPA: hypothetical protein VNE39_26840 [Planctomycetota bacterium]|nr:hypothetical protein [Planctomycetota bacterium]